MGDFIYRFTPWWNTLIAHNWPVMVCGPLILWAAIRAYLSPNRSSLLLLYSVLTIAIAFEYQKHAVPVLRGTTDYLFEIRPVLRYVSQLLLLDLLPPASYIVGILFLGLSLSKTRRRS